MYPWLALLLLFLFKPNKSFKAAAVLVAAAASMAVVLATAQAAAAASTWFMIGANSGTSTNFVFALTVLMLVSYRYPNQKAGRGFAAGVLLLAALVGIVLQFWPFPAPDMESLMPELWQCVYSIILFLAGLLVARRLCRRKFSALRLTMSFALASFLIMTVIAIGSLGSQVAFLPQFGLVFILVMWFSSAVAYPFLFIIVLFPFILLATRNSLYRERMKLLLGIPAIGDSQAEPQPLPADIPVLDPSPPEPPALPKI